MMAKSFSANDRRKTGLLVALAFALIALGVMLYIAIGQGSGSKARPLPSNITNITDDFKDPGVSNDPALVHQTSAARLQFVDKADPNRVASELSYQKLDPAGQGYFTLTQPRAWVYLKDGRTLHIRADIGEVKMPTRTQQPESGEFRGKVQVRMFPPPASADPNIAARPIDPDRDEPAMLCATDSIRFDTVLLELQTNDLLTVSSKQALFEGEGLFVKGNEVRERIESLKTKGRFVRYNPTIRNTRPETKSTSAPAAATMTPAASVENLPRGSVQQIASATPALDTAHVSPPSDAPALAPIAATSAPDAPASTESRQEQLYKTTISGNVKVVQTTRTLRADTLDIFTRLLDNQFPDNAFGTDEPVDETTPVSAEAPPADANHAHATKLVANDTPGTLVPAPVPLPPASPSAGDGSAPLFVTAGPKDIVLTWTGTLELAPILDSSSVPELADGNHFTARFDSSKPGGEPTVTLIDPDTGTSGTCSAIEYRASKRVLALLPRIDEHAHADEQVNVALDAPGAGRITAPVLLADLSSGLVTARGPGSLIAYTSEHQAFEGPLPEHTVAANLPLPEDMQRQITWTEQAEFQFKLADRKLTDEIEFASFSGTVLARERASCLAADYLQTEFIKITKPHLVANAGTDTSSSLIAFKRVRAEGNVLAVAGPTKSTIESRELPAADPYLMASKLDVLFKLPIAGEAAESTEPASVIASGDVRAVTKDETLKADRLDFALGRETGHNLEVVSARASGNVLFERADGVLARADELSADPIRKTVDLTDTTGRAVALARGPSTVIGKRMHLEEAGGTLTVIGSGAFEHRQIDQSVSKANDPRADPMRVSVRWNDGMQFRNDTGTIECVGGANVEATNALSTQTVKADKILLWLTPATSTNTGTNTGSSASALSLGELDTGPNARKLLKAEAIGSIVDRDAADGGADATIEVRRYAPGPGSVSISSSAPSANGTTSGTTEAATTAPDRVLEQFMYFKGPRIIADDVAGTVSVPAAGMAIIRDQRTAPDSANAASTNAANSPAGIAAAGTSRGTSRFIWGESMLFHRATNILNLRRDVQITHLPLGASSAMTLRAFQVDATIGNATTTNSSDASRSAELVRAVATGSVDASGGTQRLLADLLEYDAISGTAAASAASGNSITVYDQQRGPVTAKRVTWDLKRDRVDISEPAPIVVPR
jgi:lipopolysaccharide export system protein LptA